MKRLIIFQYFSRLGKLEHHVIYLLNSFKSISDKIIVISNSKLNENDKNIIEDVSDEYVERENIGFDAGAYKDFFWNSNIDNLNYWDEIILTNSSYYGPICDWSLVFDTMDRKKLDFWGLSRHYGNETLDKSNEKLPEHLQSYFIAIRKNVFLNEHFFKYWNQMEYPLNYTQAIKNFELTFTSYFAKLGYIYDSYLNQSEIGHNIEKIGDNVFPNRQAELIKTGIFPIIKYKYMDVSHYIQAKEILDYLEKEKKYDSQLLVNDILELEEKKMFPFNRKEIISFADKYEIIYVFGHGKYGNNIAAFLKDKGINIEGFIVSTPKEKSEKTLVDIINQDRLGLIVALGEKNVKQVKQSILSVLSEEKVLFPNCFLR